MLDLNFIRQFPEKVQDGAKAKKVHVDVDALLALDAKRRKLVTEVEAIRARQKTEGSKFAQEKDAAAKEKVSMELRLMKDEIKKIEETLDPLEQEIRHLIEKIPNVASDDTPIGPDESGNVVIRQVGEKPGFAFTPKDHVELGKALGIIDSEKASEVSGTRFTYLKGDLALLQYALSTYAFSVLTSPGVLHEIIEDRKLDLPEKPFTPVIPPLMIRPEVFARMARLEPREERYHIPSDDVYLIGSAEHTLGPIHMDQMLREDELPLRYAALTPAFRREAGSYGKDVKGILRLHQFDKIEMESFTVGEQSRDEQELFVGIQEHILKALGLPYQVVQICTGDMGGPDARQIDIETWMPGQDRYRETHTADLMTDYQARRLNTRVRRAEGVEYVHMNDATCIAMGRLLIAIMENFQEEDGRIRIPEILRPYMNGKTHIGG
jgi:seryl-tRNA synthetase